VFATAPPYGLTPPVFRFPALSARAARGQLGGDREVALAAFVAARLAAPIAHAAAALPLTIRAARAAGARSWLATLTLPAAVRAAFIRVADATTRDDRAALVPALAAMVDAAGRALDPRARAELDTLARQLV
jgi:hypothetical protein